MQSPIKILHIADVHLGKAHSRASYTGTIRARLERERTEALERAVAAGNQAGAHFMVVAGDLFDNLEPGVVLLDEACRILKDFAGKVLVLPGNHDYYSGRSQPGELWYEMDRRLQSSDVTLMLHCQAYAFSVGDQPVVFYPGPCLARQAATHAIGWVGTCPDKPDPAALNIGVAHGNVDGMGLDADHRYYNMTQADFAASGMDTWLLGHIHTPYPARAQSAMPQFFYAATPTPDGFNRKHGGYAWLLEFTNKRTVKMEQLRTGALLFKDLLKTLNNRADIEALQQEIEDSDLASTLLSLSVSGCLSEADRTLLDNLRQEWEQSLLLFEYDDTGLIARLDRAAIDARYAQGSIFHEMLTGILTDYPEAEADRLLHYANQYLS